jgi:hypothetical protein
MPFAGFAAPIPIRLLSEPLAPSASDLRLPLYRPLVLGPVLLVRSPGGGPWEVEVDDTSLLLPAGFGDATGIARRFARFQAQGFSCRVAATLVIPGDAARRSWPHPLGTSMAGPARRRRPLEMYGWALLYQLPDATGIAIVDSHDHHPDLPACFELPLELIDRSEHLARYGIPSRPLALITAPSDFERTADGGFRNRYAAAARFAAARGFSTA